MEIKDRGYHFEINVTFSELHSLQNNRSLFNLWYAEVYIDGSYYSSYEIDKSAKYEYENFCSKLQTNSNSKSNNFTFVLSKKSLRSFDPSSNVSYVQGIDPINKVETKTENKLNKKLLLL